MSVLNIVHVGHEVTLSALMDSGFHVDAPTGRPVPLSKPFRAGGTTRGMVSSITVLPFFDYSRTLTSSYNTVRVKIRGDLVTRTGVYSTPRDSWSVRTSPLKLSALGATVQAAWPTRPTRITRPAARSTPRGACRTGSGAVPRDPHTPAGPLRSLPSGARARGRMM